MTRQEVYRIVDGERDYQDRLWGGRQHDSAHRPAEFAAFIDRYVQLALECTDGESDEFRQGCFRKIAALAVACMEVHGAPERRPQ